MARTRNVPRTPILRSGLMAVHLARLAVTVDLPTPPFPIHHSYYYRVSELGQPLSKKYGFSKIKEELSRTKNKKQNTLTNIHHFLF